MSVEFEPIANSLREEILSRRSDEGPVLAAERQTLETNSGYAARRGELVLGLLHHAGVGALDGASLVDVGSGYGALALYLAARGARVTAVDPNGERIAVGAAVAGRHQLPVEFVQGRMQRLPLPDAAFDVALLNNSLCYVVRPEDRHNALLELMRVLRPGGCLAVRDPNRWAPRDPFSGLPLVQLLSPERASRLAAGLGRRRSNVRLVSPRALRVELVAAGFEEVTYVAAVGRSRRPSGLARYLHFVARRP